MTDEYARRLDGVREPDPTLGKNLHRKPDPAIEAILSKAQQPEPEQHAKPRRQRVVLADPRQQVNTLRARVELEEQTSWGEALVTDLVQAQLRTGLLLVLLVIVVLGALPVVCYFVPAFAGLRVMGVPLPWLLLGVLPFPLLFGVGLRYNQLAERHERDFVDMIEN
jgi:uncharacterized membrane protein